MGQGRGRGSLKALLLQLMVFAGVGGVFNVVYAVLYLVLREVMGAQPANALALIASTIVGTWGHRRVTFGVRGRARTVPHQVLGLALLAFSLAVTAGSLQAAGAHRRGPVAAGRAGRAGRGEPGSRARAVRALPGGDGAGRGLGRRPVSPAPAGNPSAQTVDDPPCRWNTPDHGLYTFHGSPESTTAWRTP